MRRALLQILHRCHTTHFSGKRGLGDTIVADGGFDTGLSWLKGTGWGIASGVASIAGSASTNAITQTVGTNGKTYLITYTVTAVSAQGFRAYAGGTNGTIRTTAGTYSEQLLCGSTNTNIGIAASAAGTTGSIDNVSVQEVYGL